MPVAQINRLTSAFDLSFGGTTYRGITTELPAQPQMYTACAGALDIPKDRDRAGNIVPHGMKKFFNAIDCQAQPTVSDGNSFLFSAPDCCPPGSPCAYFFAEPGTPEGELNWTSLVYDCMGNQPDCFGLQTGWLAGTVDDGQYHCWAWTTSHVSCPNMASDGEHILLPPDGTWDAIGGTNWPGVGGSGTLQVGIGDFTTGSVFGQSTAVQAPATGTVGTVARTPRRTIKVPGMKVALRSKATGSAGAVNTAAGSWFLVRWWAP